jgi:HNH endonuclease
LWVRRHCRGAARRWARRSDDHPQDLVFRTDSQTRYWDLDSQQIHDVQKKRPPEPDSSEGLKPIAATIGTRWCKIGIFPNQSTVPIPKSETVMSIIKICHSCENPFKSKPFRAERARFCSRQCRSSVSLSQMLKMIGYDLSPSGCWFLRCFITKYGYGRVGHEGKYRQAHRASWEVHRGPIPDGMDVLHECDVRPCINPDHLFLGTDIDNIADMDAKGRRYVLRGEENGYSVLTEAQVVEIRSRPRYHGSGTEMAVEFGVSPSLISLVRLGKVWTHVGK